MTFFSIVVATYNAESTLGECVASLLAQDYEAMEIIIVNDGSTDSTADVANTIAASQPGITVLSQSNSGALMARHEGFSIARGEYCLAVDSDDRLLPGALGRLNKVVERCGSPDIIQFNAIREGSNKPMLSLGVDSRSIELKDTMWAAESLMDDSTLNNIWSKAFKSDLRPTAARLAGTLGMKNAEDAAYVSLLFEAADSILLYNKPLYWYRRNANSVTHSFNSRYMKDIEIYRCYLRSLGLCKGISNYEERIDALYLKAVFRYLQSAFDSHRLSRDLLYGLSGSGIFNECRERVDGRRLSARRRFIVQCIAHGWYMPVVMYFSLEQKVRRHGR